MRALLSISTLSIASFVAFASIGCATTQQESAPQTPAPAVAQAPAPVTIASPMHRASRLEDHQRPAAPPSGPVTLTGQLTYGERYDPSGWSGTSIPKAVGGGPVESVEDPYADGSSASGTGSSEALTPGSAPTGDGSKDLAPSSK
ncbi:MAG: hypothetical protein NVS3B10_12040 [Polyangiales bacterium]